METSVVTLIWTGHMFSGGSYLGKQMVLKLPSQIKSGLESFNCWHQWLIKTETPVILSGEEKLAWGKQAPSSCCLQQYSWWSSLIEVSNKSHNSPELVATAGCWQAAALYSTESSAKGVAWKAQKAPDQKTEFLKGGVVPGLTGETSTGTISCSDKVRHCQVTGEWTRHKTLDFTKHQAHIDLYKLFKPQIQSHIETFRN